MKTYGVLFVALIVATILLVGNIDSVDKYEPDSALKNAIAENDASGLREALDQGADVNLVYSNELVPLTFAVAKGKVELVKILLDEGADVNVLTRYEQTPLMVAFTFGHNKVAELLLKRGADPTPMDMDGHTAMDYARAGKNTEGMKLLEKYLPK